MSLTRSNGPAMQDSSGTLNQQALRHLLAKERGVAVTAEVCPQNLVLTDESLRGYDSNLKVNPPLRRPEVRQRLGLAPFPS